MSLNDLLRDDGYPQARITHNIPDSVPPERVNDIYKTNNRLVGNKAQRIYGKFSPNINVERVWNPLTNRYDEIRGGIHYYRGDDSRVNDSLTWQKLTSADQVAQGTIDFINRQYFYGNNEENKKRINQAITSLQRKLRHKDISFAEYEAQKRAYELQLNSLQEYIHRSSVPLVDDELWTTQNKMSLWKMFRAIRNLEWENDILNDKISNLTEQVKSLTSQLNALQQTVASSNEPSNDS